MHPPPQMMVRPVAVVGQGLAADRALAVLLQPQEARPPLPRPGRPHRARPTPLEVDFPGRVVGVGRTPNLDVPDNACPGRLVQMNGVRAALFTRQLGSSDSSVLRS